MLLKFKKSDVKIDSLEVLWGKFLEGNDSAFSEIYESLYNDIFAYGQHFKVRQSLVKDTIQTLFLNLLNTRDRLNEVKNVRSYLFRSFRNLLIKSIKKEHDFLLLEENDIHEDLSNNFDEEKISKVKDLLKTLSPREKEVVLLKYYQDYNNTEISEIMGIEYATVCNISTQATKKIIKLNRDEVKLFIAMIIAKK